MRSSFSYDRKSGLIIFDFVYNVYKKKYFLLCIKTIIITDGWTSVVKLKYFRQLNELVGGGDQGEMPGESSVLLQPVRQLLQQGGCLNRLGEGVLPQLLARCSDTLTYSSKSS